MPRVIVRQKDIKEEVFNIVRDLESMGFTMPSDPLNVFNNDIEIKCEEDEVEEE